MDLDQISEALWPSFREGKNEFNQYPLGLWGHPGLSWRRCFPVACFRFCGCCVALSAAGVNWAVVTKTSVRAGAFLDYFCPVAGSITHSIIFACVIYHDTMLLLVWFAYFNLPHIVLVVCVYVQIWVYVQTLCHVMWVILTQKNQANNMMNLIWNSTFWDRFQLVTWSCSPCLADSRHCSSVTGFRAQSVTVGMHWLAPNAVLELMGWQSSGSSSPRTRAWEP